jgi:hypothetical protein
MKVFLRNAPKTVILNDYNKIQYNYKILSDYVAMKKKELKSLEKQLITMKSKCNTISNSFEQRFNESIN